MKRLLSIILISLGSFLLHYNLYAIEVEGEVSGTWTIDNSPVVVLDTIFISAENTLTIEPGVNINFAGPYSLLIYGELLAEGTEDDSIIFHPDEDNEFWCGIRADSGAVISLGYCIVRDCSVGDEDIPISGGAIYCRNTELNISNSTFHRNSSSSCGGAVYFHDGVINIENSLFSDNISIEIGGAICISGRQSSIIKNTFNSNSSIFGGALYIGSGCRIDDNRFISNSANLGGAIYTTTFLEEDCVISGNTFTENHAGNGGALLINDFNSIVVHHNIFYGNNADNCAGGVGFRRNISNTLFYSNTLAYNESQFGGGIGFMMNIGGNNEITLSDCIFWGNRADEGNQILFYDFFGLVFLSYCDIEGEWDERYSDHIIHDDPLFVDPDNDNFHLSEDSPCIDTGDPDSDPDPDGTRADMGAFHFHQRDIEVDPDTIHFETPGTIDSAAVIIRNVGLTTLTISAQSINPDDSPFHIDDGGEVEIEPESEDTTWVRFEPGRAGEYEAVLIIESDDPDEETLEIPIFGVSLGTADDRTALPAEFAIVGVHPNPFNSQTIISYSLPQSGHVSVKVYDVQGRQVCELVSGQQNAGWHKITWNGSEAKGLAVSSGVYFYKIEFDSDQEGTANLKRRMVLIK